MALKLPDPLQRSWLYRNPKRFLNGAHPERCRWCQRTLTVVTVNGEVTWTCTGNCDTPTGATIGGEPT